MTNAHFARADEVKLVEIGGLWIHRSIPALYQAKVAEAPHRVTTYTREDGAWKGYSMAFGSQRVQRQAQGLMALGVEQGDRVAVLSNTRLEWGVADLATLHAGGVTVGVYPTLLPDEVQYQLEHSGAKVVYVEDAEQLAKVESVREALPELKHVIAFEPVEDEAVLTPDQVEERGAALEDGEERFQERWRSVGPDDLATIIYTSGTTGKPKGAMLTHGNICYTVHAAATVLPHQADDCGVVFLPLAHALQRVASYGGLFTGATGYYTDSPKSLMDDIRDVQPTVQVSVPRIWEKMHARVLERVATAPPRRQRIFHWALEVGRRASPFRKQEQPLPLFLRIQHGIAKRVVFDTLKQRVFGSRIRYLTSGGAPIDIEIMEFFYAMGLLILEGWGLTETAAPATLNLPGAFKFGTVGKAIRGTEVKVAEDGELLVKGPGVFKGYYRDEEATQATFTEDGYFKTGDIGEIDSEGFVKITDRKKNLIVLSNGKNIAPQKLENLFQTIPIVGNVLVHGDRRNYLVALVTLDPEEALPWAVARDLLPQEAKDAHGEAAQKYLEKLLDHPQLKVHLEKEMRERNATLARFEQLKKWKLLPEVWSPEDGSLTPTLKLKRRVVEARHKELLDGFYAES